MSVISVVRWAVQLEQQRRFSRLQAAFGWLGKARLFTPDFGQWHDQHERRMPRKIKAREKWTRRLKMLVKSGGVVVYASRVWPRLIVKLAVIVSIGELATRFVNFVNAFNSERRLVSFINSAPTSCCIFQFVFEMHTLLPRVKDPETPPQM
jgi:hypothetical protein